MDSGNDQGSIFVRHQECLAQPATSCVLKDGTLHLHQPNLNGSGTGTGIVVEDLEVPLIIHGAQVRGFSVAISVDGTCSQCPIRVEGGHLEATEVVVLLGKEKAVSGELTFTGTTILAGATARAPDGLPTYGLGQGIRGMNVEKGVVLSNISMKATAPGLGPAVLIESPVKLVATNLEVEGFEQAVTGDMNEVHLRGAKVHCNHEARFVFAQGRAILLPTATVDIDGLQVTGCNRAVDDDRSMQYAIDLTRHEGSGGDVVIRNVVLDDNQDGIAVSRRDAVLLENFTITNGDVGVHVQDVQELHLKDGLLRNLSRTGITTWANDLRVDHVIFSDIGRPDVVGWGLYVGQSADQTPAIGSWVVHNSSFVGTRTFAVAGEDNAVDARYNWWGSSRGPWHSALPKPDGFGERVSGTVVTYPFLTSPP